ncbi:MAG: class I SAM-dependent methyltransferase [Deltaproteobacteria bacterium]|nr:class I SAM-dependent methyltransferase [Deltaproteobacteria bacterium]
MTGAWEVLAGREPGLALDALERYAQEIERWNRSIRLVGPKDREGIRLQIADALLPFLWERPSFPLLDLGSGAGLPAVPLAVAFPGQPLVALEPNAKKASFLRNALRLLGLKEARVIVARAEEAFRETPELAAAFATVTARAVAEPEVLLPLLAPYLAPSGRALLPRGEEPGPDIEGWVLAGDRPYEGPPGLGKRRVLVYRRNA